MARWLLYSDEKLQDSGCIMNGRLIKFAERSNVGYKRKWNQEYP